MKFIGRNKLETNRFYLRRTKKEENNNDLDSYLITKTEYFDEL